MSYSIVRRRRRPNASLLAEAVRTIGKRRFEIRQQVSCPLEDRKLHYLVETWFFFPQSLQINRWSYTATDYQQSLKNYIRLGVPIRPLESLLGGELPPPLRKLEAEEGGGEEIIERNSFRIFSRTVPGGLMICCGKIRRKPANVTRTASNCFASRSGFPCWRGKTRCWPLRTAASGPGPPMI